MKTCLQYFAFAFFISIASSSGACQLSDDYDNFRPAGVCIGEHTLDERRERILARLDQKPLKVKTINASINHFSFRVKSVLPGFPDQPVTDAKEALYIHIKDNDSFFR